MVDSNSALADLGRLIESLPFEYLLIGHCLIVASWFPKLKDRYLLSFWVSPRSCSVHSFCGNPPPVWKIAIVAVLKMELVQLHMAFPSSYCPP